MTKKEIIWREILHRALTDKKLATTQKELAEEFNLSLSTVFNALKIPRSLGAVKVTGKNFNLVDFEKLLYIWATHRNFEKDITYRAHVDASAAEIEGMMPGNAIFACMSAYVQKYQDAPADYDKVYVYAPPEDLMAIKNRFPSPLKTGKGYANLFVLKADPFLAEYGSVTADEQTFVDLWNLGDWYAKEFLESLKKKILS